MKKTKKFLISLLAFASVSAFALGTVACGDDGSNTGNSSTDGNSFTEQPTTRTLKFDGNGATSGDMAEIRISNDETVTLTTNSFLKDYHHFIGWALTPDGDVAYADGAEYTMGTNSEYILYAVWEYGTNGIEYTLSDDGTYYFVSGYSGVETNVGIPSAYNDLPVTSISESAFWNCSNLTGIEIPDSVTSIDYSVFSNTAYYNNESNWENDVLYIGKHLIKAKTTISGAYTIKADTLYIDYSAFEDCSSLTSVTIPDSVTSIDYSAFEDCSKLTNVIIGSNVTNIGDYAFFNCRKLTSISIPDSVTSIGYYAFYFCSSLTSVVIGDSVTSIGSGAFSGCSSLTNITIPDSVTSIGSSVFSNCSNLTYVTFKDTSTWYRTNDWENWNNKATAWSMMINVTYSVTNATYFKSTYVDSYWFKK